MGQSSQRAFDFDDHGSLQARACEGVAYWIGRAREILALDGRRLPAPEVRFDLRGRAAGQAVFTRRTGKCVIRINDRLLNSHPQDMLAETVPHEVAHAVIYRLYGRSARPHGVEWKALMRAFGVTPEVCHALPAEPSRRLTRYRYVCGCDEPVWLTSIRHRRARSGTDYCCRCCGEILVYAPQ